MSEIIQVPVSSYKRRVSSFGIEGNAYWYVCRDGFQYNSEDKDIIFYYHHKYMLANIVKFINKIEGMIGLGEARKLKFLECNDSKVLCMKLSKFWKHKARRSLLTILIRAGRNYDDKKDNWKECIEKSMYCRSKRTKESVFRFIEGHTRFPRRLGYFGGWCNYFGYSSKPVKDILS